jgi:hypothetical protein
VKENEMGGACSAKGCRKGIHMGNYVKRLRSPSFKWVDIIKIDIKEIEWSEMQSVGLT